jgi:G protein-coupled receptor 107
MKATALALACVASTALARIHHLHIQNDPRFAFSIESFGFESGGEMEISIHDVKAEPADAEHRMGFVLFPAQSESNVAADIDSLIVKNGCALDYSSAQIYVIDVSDKTKWSSTITEKLAVEGGGMFDLMFTHCSPTEGAKVSFSLDYTFRNPGPNYLSAGEIPLPAVYGFLTVLFAMATGVWFWYCRRNRQDIHKIHYLMSLMVVIKTLTLMFESVMYYFIAKTGHSTGWNVAYYILTFIRGSLLVVIIALIGAGWSLLKPFLTDREKKVLMVVLPLQVSFSRAASPSPAAHL